MILSVIFLFFFKQKTAYEMRISDWSSDMCSSDLASPLPQVKRTPIEAPKSKDGDIPEMKARVTITLKPGVLDPQGKAIEHALDNLGFSGVEAARAGKVIALALADGTSDAQLHALYRTLLPNTDHDNLMTHKLSPG